MNYNKLFSICFFLLLLTGCSTDETGGSNGIDKSANLKSLGISANDLLSDENYTSLKIEVVYVSGYAPSPATLDNLTRFLTERVYKPDGISISTRAVASSGKAPFTINEISEIEAEERSVFNSGDEIAVYIYFADGSNEEDTAEQVVLGSAYRNTSMVIYGKTVQTVVSRNNAPDKSTVESTVLNHEFGHLFGLVNLGSPPQTNHEDEESSRHCSVEGCLMNAKLIFGSILIDVVDNNRIPELEELCILDLQANGGK